MLTPYYVPMSLWEKIKAFFWNNRLDLGIAAGLFILAAIPRLVDLGLFLTADEKNWIGRSYEFVRAFKDIRFNDMLQTTHPGVTTLWLSGAATVITIVSKGIPFSFQSLSHFIWPAQLAIALANAALIPLMYWLLHRLLHSRPVAVIAVAAIALNPWLIGYSRVVHVDALLAGLMFLAALALMVYAREGYSRRWLIFAAAVSALALLTKVPAIFLVPFSGLVVLVYGWRQGLTAAFLRARARDGVLWLLIVGLLFVTIWPALLWVPDPKGNVLTLKRDISTAALTPHHMVEDYTLNPGHYLATLATRIQPLILLLVALAGLRIGWRLRQRHLTERVRVALLLVAYVFFFVLMMTLGAKKGDRYILAIAPALDVLAVVGIGLVSKLFGASAWRAFWLLSSLLVFTSAYTVYSYHPYTISYSNPFVRDNLSQELGWGEGLEQVAAWFNDTAPQAVVASWYPEELGFYTSARVAHLNAHEQSNVQYIVLYRNMFSRAPDHPANDFIDEYYKKREPVFVATVVGKEFAWVYEKMAYERVLEELLPGQVAEQAVSVLRPGSAGVQVLFATYAGRATAGEVLVEVWDERRGTLIHRERVPVSQLKDDRWHTIQFPQELTQPATLRVRISATGTAFKNAPTIRYTAANRYREQDMRLNDRPVRGNLAVRLLFNHQGKLVTEEETKLLPEPVR
jgi:4-amino-4-deoxy-L-arabinose transferase-like glycosyltransferase